MSKISQKAIHKVVASWPKWTCCGLQTKHTMCLKDCDVPIAKSITSRWDRVTCKNCLHPSNRKIIQRVANELRRGATAYLHKVRHQRQMMLARHFTFDPFNQF